MPLPRAGGRPSPEPTPAPPPGSTQEADQGLDDAAVSRFPSGEAPSGLTWGEGRRPSLRASRSAPAAEPSHPQPRPLSPGFRPRRDPASAVASSSGSRPPPRPGLFTPPGSSSRRRRCRLLSTLAPLPIRPPPPPPPQPRLSGASSSQRTLRNTDSSRAGRKLPRSCWGWGGKAVREPAASPPLSSSRSAPSATSAQPVAPAPRGAPPPRGLQQAPGWRRGPSVSAPLPVWLTWYLHTEVFPAYAAPPLSPSFPIGHQ